MDIRTSNVTLVMIYMRSDVSSCRNLVVMTVYIGGMDTKNVSHCISRCLWKNTPHLGMSVVVSDSPGKEYKYQEHSRTCVRT